MHFRANLDKQSSDVANMFNGVAKRYDRMNDLMSLGQVRFWRRQTTAAIAPRPGQLVLDLAAGTGMSSESYLAAGALVFPTDISIGMLTEGKKRFPSMNFVCGDATRLPYADNSFDAVTISYGLRNVQDTQTALSEMLRVTKPGGRVVIAEFSRPTSCPFRHIYNWYLDHVMPLLQRFSTNDLAYDYLVESIKNWPAQRELADLMLETGWRGVQWKNLTGGIVALHRGFKDA